MAMARSFRLTCVRHGLTAYNEEHRYIGSTDLPLSEAGFKQMKELADKLPKDPFVVSSDLLRCLETTELLFPNHHYQSSKLLREYDFGEWEGCTYEELKDRESYQKWLVDPLTVTPPNGEALKHFQRRTRDALAWVIHEAIVRKKEAAVVITHGGVIRQWLSTYAPMEKAFFEWNVSIGTIITLSGNLEQIRRGERFTSLQEERFTEKTAGPCNL